MKAEWVLITDDGAVLGGVPCVHCGHPLNAHNTLAAPGAYLRCDDCACFGFVDRISTAEKEEPTVPKITTTTTTSISTSNGFTIGDLQSFLDQVPRPQGLDTHVTVEYADPGEFVLSVTV